MTTETTPEVDLNTLPPWVPDFLDRMDLLQEALNHTGGTHTVEDIGAGLMDGRFQMFTGPRSVVITEIQHYPQSKACHVFLAAGDMGEIEMIAPHVENWGRRNGCKVVSLAGRKGWARTFLKDRGYEPKWFVVAKELKDEQGR